MKNPLILIIMDGFGLRSSKKGNAVKLAKLPNYNHYMKNYPHSILKASSLSVGLPEKTMGNSEVGHLNIGAGRIVYQELTRINLAIKNKSFFKNKVLNNALKKIKKNNSLHFIGLLSDAGVHSNISHLFALLKLAKLKKIKNVYVHILTDGRDTPPRSALKYVSMLEKEIKKLKIGKIASVIGRYYAMDRDKRWNRTEKAYNLLVNVSGLKASSAKEAVLNSYKKNISDEFILPTAINGFSGIKNNDTIIFFNFRSDRARQITKAFLDDKFDYFKRRKIKVNYVCMCEYDKNIKTHVAFPPSKVKNSLGEVFSKNKLKQLRIAETEKYAHVTYFFNGGIEKPSKNEGRIIIPSPKVATYDLTPEMSADKIKSRVIQEIKKKKYDAIILNFANPDMVGHTGKLDKAIKAVETVDKCLKHVVDEITKQNGTVLITADHGNCEEMEGKYKTSHTLNPVPFIVLKKGIKLRNGILADIAPTILDLLKIKKPKEMTGKSLIIKS